MLQELKGRDFLTLKDYSKEEIKALIDLAIELKGYHKQGIRKDILAGKTLAMIFQKSSTRTRVSFEAGMYQLGGLAHFLSTQDLQMGRGEPISDTARVLSRYVDGILIRTYAQAEVEELAKYADVPVINGLTDLYHPTQALADMLTIYEHKGYLEGIKLAYIGDGNNMVHSLMIAGAKLGMEVRVATPKGYEPQGEIVKMSQDFAKVNGGKIILSNNPEDAVQGADVLYTDVWASMGQEEEAEIRKKHFQGFQINAKMLELANKKAIVMHCLPAHRGEEITHEVMEGSHSVVFDEAENRLHAHKAILAALL
ncbi:MAG: ornithine carbamoyltransferase [Clostridia bacterium]|jgi:ornithine carbamoyltransferase|nr:ornithine carbamoyltransferase [Clostridia bacterium]